MSALSVSEIAALCTGEVRGDADRLLHGANTIEDAGPQDLSFIANDRAAAAAVQSKAGCLLAAKDFANEGSWSVITVANPRAAFAQVLAKLYPATPLEAMRHPTALVHASASVGANVHIDAYAVIEARVTIGDGCFIGSHSVIGEGVIIGPECYLHSRVTIYPNVHLGARCVLHSGSVLGADGFGFAQQEGRYRKFPQVGMVIIGDDVEIGANACVDRAALGRTSVGSGTKLDNLVHVGHNCKIGKHVVIAAQTGLSGGVQIGDYAVVAGQVGFADRATVAPHAVVGAQAGILPGKHIPAGEPYWGTPARPLRQHLKGLAHVNKLPLYQEELRALKGEVERSIASAASLKEK